MIQLKKVLSLGLIVVTSTSLFAQKSVQTLKTQQLNATDPQSTNSAASNTKEYKYESVKGDLLNARIYTLDNGLKVYLSVYKDAPRIQTYIATKAGSKSDPADATGLAHYLEHLLFKGTDKFGSLNYSKEKVELDKIEALYETYRTTKDEAKRKTMYHQIDSISGVAAKFAIANEYDKMLTSIGAKGTNAFTSFEQTVYVNDIPSNQLEKWLTIEAERFRNPVLRIFHTELEAVYEEKNRGLDNDGRKVFETLFATIFPNNNYGKQTTIGTIEHLKNPSIKKIKEYYDTYYVPNNMAICMSGDFDYEQAIRLIDSRFGSMKSKPVPVYTPGKEEPITKPIIKEVFGPDAESMLMAYRLGGLNTKDAEMAELAGKILYNGTAGLIDLNLNQQQKVLSASVFPYILKDYGVFILEANAKEGQTLEQTKDLVLAEVEKLKKGEFPDWMLKAIINDIKLQQTREFEDNGSRAMAMVGAFISEKSWIDYTNHINKLAAITKQEIVAWANANFKDNYVVVYKRTGEDKNVQKVVKPEITPVEVNRDEQSPFLKSILEAKAPAIEPVFIDYEKDIVKYKTLIGAPIYCTQNKENNLFSMYYVLEMGKNNDKKLGLAVEYLNFLGTTELTNEQLKQEFYKLGCNYNVFTSEDRVNVSLEGLNESFETALKLFESLLKEPKPDKEALNNLVSSVIKQREDDKLSKGKILWSGMYNYAVFGAKSPFTNILSSAELKAVTPEELIQRIKELTSYQHDIYYYGPLTPDILANKINANHKANTPLKNIPSPTVFAEQENKQTDVYVIDYDMKQAEIMMLSKDELYNRNNIPVITLFNEYFGGGMGSIVFQTMRESKALAYSVFSNYRMPSIKDRSHYALAYIGTQADKLPEAMKGMFELMNNLPESENMFNSAKKAVEEQIRTERITKSEILFNYMNAKKMGNTYDMRKDVFEKVPSMKFENIKSFQQAHFKDKKYNIMVLGNKSTLDIKALESYGKVTYLKLEDVFGY
ncbi:MAG TPA: insulinase family protein [Bacteroidia bacterium]|nr:insulinase family protein [Bacteroidia bacterium]